MKKSLIIAFVLLVPTALFSQGTARLDNLTDQVDARVFLPDGQPVTGGFRAQLFAGSAGAREEDLVGLFPITSFRTGSAAAAGYLNPVEVTIPGVASGAIATLQIRVYNGSTFATSTVSGKSVPITVPLGGSTLPPAALVGLQSFSLSSAPIVLARGVPKTRLSSEGFNSTTVKKTLCGDITSSSVWFRLQAEINGLARISSGQFPSNTLIAVFAGNLSDAQNLRPLNCARMAAENNRNNALQFEVSTNQDYWLAVDTATSQIPFTVACSFAGPKWIDHNDDDRSDVALQHADGSVCFWHMNGLAITNWTVDHALTAEQRVVALGNFDSIEKPTLVVQVRERRLEFRSTDWAKPFKASLPVIDLASGWTIVASGDFNGDQQPDIVLQNVNRSVAFWLMNRATITNGLLAPYKIDPGWTIAVANDFNGDGYSDIVCQHTDGSIAFWLMRGTTIISVRQPYKVDPRWRIAGTGDFNKDLNADIVLQNIDGTIAFWLMKNEVVTEAYAPFKVDGNWTLCGPR